MWSNTNYWPYLLQRRQQAYGFDEAHRLRKGKHGKKGWWETINWLRTKTKSTHRQTPLWLLTGTPIVKDATDVWPLLHLANPDVYRKRDDFAQDYCYTTHTPYKLEVGKLRNPPRFHDLMRKYSIRRGYKDIPELASLDKREILVPVELTQSELLRHRVLKRDWRDPVTNTALDNPSSLIRALRRLTIEPKIAAWSELVADHPGRWLVLCWYRDSVSLAYQAAVKLFGRDKVGVITGGASELSRETALHAYRDGGVLIGTIAALGEGLNLQQGYQVAFLEESWLSVDNDQALARVLRRGQTQPVLVFKLRAPKTFDMRVARVAAKRGTDIEKALDEFLGDEEWNE
jgi:SNF2 family DNA or RNA helicase